jgi:hypothetical protein
VAGVASVLPAASAARTSNVCDRLDSPVYDFGDEHAPQPDPSSWHSNVEPVSDDEKEKLADEPDTVPLGPESIVVSGGVVSA